MDVFFYLVPSLMLAGLLTSAVFVIRRSHRFAAAWNGLTAEARCLRVYTTTHREVGEHRHTRTTLNHVYEFTARDGRRVRFEEEGGPATVLEGDITVVHYTEDQPERATALPPMRGRLLAESGVLLAFLGVAAAGCVVFMIGVHTFFDLADGVFGGGPSDLPDDFPADLPTDFSTP